MDKYDAINSLLIILYESHKLRDIGFDIGIYGKINIINTLLHIYSIYEQDECLKYTYMDNDVCIVKECHRIPGYFDIACAYNKLSLNTTDIDNICVDIGSLYTEKDPYNTIKKILTKNFQTK